MAIVWSSDCNRVAQMMHAVIMPRCVVVSSSGALAVAAIDLGVFFRGPILSDQEVTIKPISNFWQPARP